MRRPQERRRRRGGGGNRADGSDLAELEAILDTGLALVGATRHRTTA
ncbi:hypothetical protein ACIOKD_13975 [Streptomyces sp. NPDC087844]